MESCDNKLCLLGSQGDGSISKLLVNKVLETSFGMVTMLDVYSRCNTIPVDLTVRIELVIGSNSQDIGV